MSRPPDGTVTFLLTDVEASSRGWAADGAGTEAAFRALDAVVADATAACGGVLRPERGEGDSHFAAFDRASDAIVAAHRIQAGLAASGGAALRVRAAVHTGEIAAPDGDYRGIVPNQAARLRSAAHGGQVLVSATAAAVGAAHLPGGLGLVSLGFHRVRDFPGPVEILQLCGPGLNRVFPPLQTLDDASGLMSVAVVDAVSSRRRLEPLTDRGVADWTRWFAPIVRAEADRRGARWLRLFGDGCLAAFADPNAAVAFVDGLRTEMGRHGVDIRAGIDVSCVQLVDGELAGAAAWGAALLARDAAPGETATSPQTKELLVRAGPQAS